MVDVGDGRTQNTFIIAEHADGEIASRAEQPTDSTGRMAMIQREDSSLPLFHVLVAWAERVIRATDGASSFLPDEHLFVLFLRQSELPEGVPKDELVAIISLAFFAPRSPIRLRITSETVGVDGQDPPASLAFLFLEHGRAGTTRILPLDPPAVLGSLEPVSAFLTRSSPDNFAVSAPIKPKTPGLVRSALRARREKPLRHLLGPDLLFRFRRRASGMLRSVRPKLITNNLEHVPVDDPKPNSVRLFADFRRGRVLAHS